MSDLASTMLNWQLTGSKFELGYWPTQNQMHVTYGIDQLLQLPVYCRQSSCEFAVIAATELCRPMPRLIAAYNTVTTPPELHS
jgi:hypothetical protein